MRVVLVCGGLAPVAVASGDVLRRGDLPNLSNWLIRY